MQKKIFVSIAAYNDPHLEYTIKNALLQADHPDALVFGVLNQTTSPKSDRIMLQNYPVRLMQITPQESYGVSWARSVIQSLYDNEPYTLQIDSHMVFENGWDTLLIETLNSLPEKAILSNYPYGYSRVGDTITMDCEVSNETTLVIRPKPDQAFSHDQPTLLFHSRHFPERALVRCCHIAGGFYFTRGYFIQEVPYDPQWYFHGEEQGLTLRAFTHGWDAYHIPHIPIYHLYKEDGTEHKGHHWHPKWKRPAGQVAHLEERARKRLIDLIDGNLRGVYGLGNVRTLDEYAELFGIDYKNFVITEPEGFL